MTKHNEAVENTQVAEAVNEHNRAVTPVTSFNSIESLRSLPARDRIKAMAMVTSYQGAESTEIDKWLGKEMPVIGVAFHAATVNQKRETIDRETGEMKTVEESVDQTRQVFKLQGYPAVGCIAQAAQRFIEDMLIPVFGFGDWIDENGEPIVVKVIPRQVSTGKGRTYNFQIVE